MTVRVSTLPNGLRIVTDEMPHLKSASVGVWADVGARHETAEQNGISHMLEHMAFKGTATRSARAIAEEIEAVGGHLNAFTSREQTAYVARVLSQDLPLAVDLLADILQRSAFDPGELERERAVILQEIGQTLDTPDDLVFENLQETAFPRQALGRGILGAAKTVGSLNREALIGYMARHYRGPSMVVAAAGGLVHDRLVELVTRAFGDLPGGETPGYEALRYVGGESRVKRDLEQVHLVLGFPGVNYTDPDFYAMQVYATLLGGGMSSRLFQEVREVRGLAYAIYAFASSYADGGLFEIYAGAGEEQTDELVGVIADEMAKTPREVGEGEIERAKAQHKAGLLMSLESSSARIEQLARQMLIFGRPLPLDEVVAKIDAVDGPAIRRVAERLPRSPSISLAAIGPLGRLENYVRIAARFG